MNTENAHPITGQMSPVVQPQSAPWHQGLRWGLTSATHLVAFVIAVVMVFPLLWMFSTSVKPAEEMFVFPPHLLPSQWHVEN